MSIGRRRSRPLEWVRPLRPPEYAAALELCRRDPVASVMVAVRLKQLLAGHRPAGEMLGLFEGDQLVTVCWSGANLVPIPDPTGHAMAAFAERALRQGRYCSAICGSRAEVLQLWEIVAEEWAPAREVRASQPSMAIDGPPLLPGDPLVRPASPVELDAVFDAAVRMFTEEVGYSPLVAGDSYRARVVEQVKGGSMFVRSWPPERRHSASPPLLFKGEVGARALGVAQLQGLWIEPSARRRGYGAGCVAAMVERLFAEGVGVVSLYVNDYNTAARRLYDKLGFEQVGEFATVLL